MARRELLSAAEREALLAFPVWQGFPGENRLKSHSETRVRRKR
jgi:hypothetical protein